MLAQGKITADEAERLLSLVDQPPGTAPGSKESGETRKPAPKYLRVVIQEGDGPQSEHVNIRVPMGLIRAGVRLASVLPSKATSKINEKLKEKGVPIDVEKIKSGDLDDRTSGRLNCPLGHKRIAGGDAPASNLPALNETAQLRLIGRVIDGGNTRIVQQQQVEVVAIQPTQRTLQNGADRSRLDRHTHAALRRVGPIAGRSNDIPQRPHPGQNRTQHRLRGVDEPDFAWE